MSCDRNQAYFQDAQDHMVGGVNSPVRAYQAVGGTPRVIQQGQGARITDLEGQSYIDYVCGFGSILLGHNHDSVLAAVVRTAAQGIGFSAPHQHELTLTRLIHEMIPTAQKVRLMNSGTEACATAIRLARGVTGRRKIMKFSGGYHGHVDSLLVAAGSGAQTQGVPSSAGVPRETVQHTLVVQYNDLAQVRQCFADEGNDLAAVIIEPIAGNMGMVMPSKDFLSGVQSLCREHGALLIMDEVMTGFRVAPYCAQALFDVWGDITVLGKVIGGGLPVGAIAGSEKVMQYLAPQGPVYQAGTLSGNPLTCAAGAAVLQHLQRHPDVFERLHERTTYLIEGMKQIATDHEVPFVGSAQGGMLGWFLSDQPVCNIDDVRQSRLDDFRVIFQNLLKQGVYLAPSPYEAGFITLAHEKTVLDETLASFKKACQALVKKRS